MPRLLSGTRFLGWSMSKTVTALIGMLVADGRPH
jgi:CubicO group peptidase (beta-lactamase class C family)